MAPPGKPEPKIGNSLDRAWTAVQEWMIVHWQATWLLGAVAAVLWVSARVGPLDKDGNLTRAWIQAGYLSLLSPLILGGAWMVVMCWIVLISAIEAGVRAAPRFGLVAGLLFVLYAGFGERIGCASSPKQRSNRYSDPRYDYDDRDPPWHDGRW